MASLIPNITISEFKKLKAAQIKELSSCEVFSDGMYLFTFINAQTEFIRIKAEYLSLRGNAVGGKTIEQILEVEGATV